MDVDERPQGSHFAPRANKKAPRPDETAVFVAAAQSYRHAERKPRPDETSVFLDAALRAGLAKQAQAPASAVGRHAAPADAAPVRGAHAVSAGDVAAPADGGMHVAAASGAASQTGRLGVLDDEGAASTGRLDDVVPAAPTGALAAELDAPEDGRAAVAASSSDDDFDGAGDYESVGRSAGLMTGLIIISRLTGFARTWVMGIAFGVSFLASSYNIANNLPNMLYELVVGGMLVTAFLPVYMDARRNGGREAANDYVGNLLSVLLVLLGVVSVLAVVFAPAIIWTQSFMSDGQEMDVAVYFFRFFALQILFYGLGSVFSGVLNAHRDYFWSNFAPVLNNVVVIAAFALFPVLEPISQQLALTVLAVGTTLGVFVQMACQIPALAKHGVHPRMHINLRDPLLKKTLELGVPTLLATLCTLVTASVQNSSALAVQPGTGASVIAYARLWYTLPYALLSVSLNTALYTELARDATRGDDDAVRAGMSRGIAQQLFFLVPFALYLMVFSFPLNMVYCSGRFDLAGVELVSEYLRFLAVSLPFYGVCMLMQKGCSALRDMRPYALFMLAGAVAEVAWSLVLAVGAGGGMPFIALSMTASYVVSDLGALIWMRRRLHGLRVRTILHGLGFGLLLGGLGAAAGGGVLALLEAFVGPLATTLADGTTQTAGMLQTVAYVAAGGIVSLLVTFGPAVALKLPEADMLRSLARRVRR
ncbi:murein biosynthesis integral membrane protein MurJ [Enorma phocaeensis]|uniref:murein biosynthesis integral membrane protein MurJ n=1 Tax=Enorma phocaeensis TaxID=1871019 RepID=UPI00195C1470|nr:murein biosynthesis integral membrane protein MurJ [Enorma phocaeensis]MBM6953346.1 murein biosynthesis integral membrane protein MurJ [Enorma phocaeensis]